MMVNNVWAAGLMLVIALSLGQVDYAVSGAPSDASHHKRPPFTPPPPPPLSYLPSPRISRPQIGYLTAHPNLLRSLALFSLTSALGQVFVFWTIRTFDSLTFSTITTTRKFFTIVLSVVYFGHRLSTQQWGAVGAVFAGLALETVAGKDKDKHVGGKNASGKADGSAAVAAAEAPGRASGGGGEAPVPTSSGAASGKKHKA